MHKKFIKFSFLTLQALILSACLFGDSREEHVLNDNVIPALKVQNLKGEPIVLFDETHLEKPALVNAWATWCTPCVHEMPMLDELAKRGDLDVYAISSDVKLETVNDFLSRNDFHYLKVYLDVFGKESRDKWQASRLPMTFLVNKKGKVVEVFYGVKAWDDESFYKGLLKKVGL